DVVAALEDIMKHTYSIFTMGREYARCIYLKWYITDKTAKSVALLETLSSEFDITTDSNTGWATLRMCWC
ncbi:MAG: hypothetical protein KAJ19_08725, partial [Gammaproteobacteria bacterium]|nr:hypothetical protein [Gammaproteobacteria bacterium]